MLQQISSQEALDTIVHNSRFVLLDFTATWCGPCKRMKPALKEMQGEFRGVKFCVIDVDECPEIKKRYSVLCMPTFVFIRDGRCVPSLTIEGAAPADVGRNLRRLVEKDRGLYTRLLN